MSSKQALLPLGIVATVAASVALIFSVFAIQNSYSGISWYMSSTYLGSIINNVTIAMVMQGLIASVGVALIAIGARVGQEK